MKFWLLSLAVALAVAPLAPAAALPPVPEWPVIGPLLVKLGLVEPVRTPDPTLPEYTVTTMDELKALEDQISPGERARVVVAESLAQSLVINAMEEAAFLRNVTLDFTERGALVTLEIDRSALEQGGARLPFIKGDTLKISAQLIFYARDGRLQVKVRALRINGLPLPVGGLLAGRLNALSAEKWPAWIKLEAVFMHEQDVAIEGAYNQQ